MFFTITYLACGAPTERSGTARPATAAVLIRPDGESARWARGARLSASAPGSITRRGVCGSHPETGCSSTPTAVVESMSPDREMFGASASTTFFEAAGGSRSGPVARRFRSALAGHGPAEPAPLDDISILALEYRGLAVNPRTLEMTITSEIENVSLLGRA